MELRVLTFNCWGLHADAKFKERLKHIAEEMELYDIACLQEIWWKEDYDEFVGQVSSSLPYSHHFRNRSFFGSGLCIFSKYPIASVIGHQFEIMNVMRDFGSDITALTAFTGKGVLYCRMETPHGTIAVFNTHINPMCRASQMFDLTNFISNVSGEDPVILCGDFNTREADASYRLITECLELRDVYSDDHVSNVFTLQHGKKEKRVDFIFHSEDFALVSRKLAFTGHIPGKDYPYERVEAILNLSDESCHKKKGRKSREMNRNALQTLLIVSNEIKLKQQKLYCKWLWPEAVQFSVIVLMPIVVQGLAVAALSLVFSILVYALPEYQHKLVWMTTSISMVFGILIALVVSLIFNEAHQFNAMAGNTDKINTILERNY